MRGESDSGEARGARFGRLSSEHPNLQNQPSRDDFASMWRAIYVPDEGVWFSADFSQQEPRILTHFAELMVDRNGDKLVGAEAAGNRYRADPKTDTHQMMADLCSIGRDPAKGIYLGICYGMGGAKLARQLGLPTVMKEMPDGKMVEMAGPEAQALLAKFDQYAPFVRLLAKKVSATAMKRGYIKTLSGRRCHFPEGADGKRMWAHKAINRLIQGSAGDQIKTAMVMVDAAGLPQQLQVHDELDGSATVEQAREIAAIMVSCVPLTVPSLVKVKAGPSWGGAEKIK
jgi:DNA polymerase I-like protein with 3'-5' exonuclease and polymerase domains